MASRGRRSRAGGVPGVEVMEGRTVLSASLSGGFLTPTSAAMARAQSVIAGAAATEFARYQVDLQRAEASSGVTTSAFAALKSDGAALEQAIQSAPLTSTAETQDLIDVQDLLDQSFLEGSFRASQWDGVSQQMGQALYGVVFTTNLPNQTFTDMQTVAKEARVTPSERQRLIADEQAITTAMGPDVQTALGGSVPRNPLMVYYDRQVAQFVRRKGGARASR